MISAIVKIWDSVIWILRNINYENAQSLDGMDMTEKYDPACQTLFKIFTTRGQQDKWLKQVDLFVMSQSGDDDGAARTN